MTTSPLLPHQPDWRHLSEVFSQIKDAEGERDKALKALAVRMDTNKGMWFATMKDAEFGRKVKRAEDAFMIDFKIDPEKNSAVGSARYWLGRRRNSYSGAIVIERICLLKSEVDRLWPPTKTRIKRADVAKVTVNQVHTFLEKTADGNTTKPALKIAAKAEFGGSVPVTNVFERAWEKLDDSKKLKPGMKPRKNR